MLSERLEYLQRMWLSTNYRVLCQRHSGHQLIAEVTHLLGYHNNYWYMGACRSLVKQAMTFEELR